jgi:Flp pilus assembly protein TadG
VSRRADNGVSTVELAVLMPVLLFWMMLIVQFGLWAHAKQVATAAADAAADTTKLPDGTEHAGEAEAEAVLATAGNLSAPIVHVDRTFDTVTVDIRGDAPRLVPGFAWAVTAHASAPVERFVAEGAR